MISYSPDITAPFDLGTAAVYTCNTRFFLEGNMMRSCGGSEASIVGAWDGTDPRCSGIELKTILSFFAVQLKYNIAILYKFHCVN